MNLIKNLLVAVAAAGFVGSAHATDKTFDLGTLSPTVAERTDFYSASGVSLPYSFMDVFNFTVDANYRTLTGSAVKYTPSGFDARLTNISDLKFELFSGSDALGTLLGTDWSLDGSRIDLKAHLDPGDFSARISGTADGELGGGFYFSVAAVPEPAEWMLLLSGLVIVGFMARRKTSWPAG
ncbi:MAG: FxDxF family PEP-CTERM protein [Betaproteobacteria bacterium]|nr:FxDxF family PEP-CTERM protein [Betaproteobacteria bacterium]